MKNLLITSCIITIMAVAPISATYAAGDAAGTTAATPTDNDKIQQNEKTMSNDGKMKSNHEKMKGKSNGKMKDMKDMPM